MASPDSPGRDAPGKDPAGRHSAGRGTGPRTLVIGNDPLEFGNIEAWINIIESYRATHPHHRVLILYEGEVVEKLTSLFRRAADLNVEGFQLVVDAPEDERKDVPKLFRLLVEGAGPNYRPFIRKEIHRVLRLF